MRVLLVDDNPDHQFLAKRALAAMQPELDIVAEVASDGEEAIRRLLRQPDAPPPDLVILDIKMPGRNGFEVLEALRSDERTRRLRVVMMSSSEDSADVARAMELGADEYLIKSMDPREFRQTLHEAIRRSFA